MGVRPETGEHIAVRINMHVDNICIVDNLRCVLFLSLHFLFLIAHIRLVAVSSLLEHGFFELLTVLAGQNLLGYIILIVDGGPGLIGLAEERLFPAY